jgi:hypothetical protein
MKMSTMKMPNIEMPNMDKTWKGLPSDYKVFLIVTIIFFLLSPGIVVNIDEPSDLLHIISDNMGNKEEMPMEILSLVQAMWNKLTFNSINSFNISEIEKNQLTSMRAVLVHSVVAGLIATFLLKV